MRDSSYERLTFRRAIEQSSCNFIALKLRFSFDQAKSSLRAVIKCYRQTICELSRFQLSNDLSSVCLSKTKLRRKFLSPNLNIYRPLIKKPVTAYVLLPSFFVENHFKNDIIFCCFCLMTSSFSSFFYDRTASCSKQDSWLNYLSELISDSLFSFQMLLNVLKVKKIYEVYCNISFENRILSLSIITWDLFTQDSLNISVKRSRHTQKSETLMR